MKCERKCSSSSSSPLMEGWKKKLKIQWDFSTLNEMIADKKVLQEMRIKAHKKLIIYALCKHAKRRQHHHRRRSIN